MQRSGSEEDYTELAGLLEDISSYMADLAASHGANKSKQKKDEGDKMKGLEIRKAAMVTHACNYISSERAYAHTKKSISYIRIRGGGGCSTELSYGIQVSVVGQFFCYHARALRKN